MATQAAPKVAATPRPVPSRVTPHLQLGARLSQILLNRWTVLLVLVLVRFLFAVEHANTSLTTARREALQACIQVESLGSSIASMPSYMAVGVNDMTAEGLESAVGALSTMLEMVVTSVEEMVVFVVRMMASSYLCLIALAARGSIQAVGDVSTEMSESMQKSVGEIADSLDDASKTLSTSFDDIQKTLDKAPFSDGLSLPNVDFASQIDRLRSLKLESELRDGVGRLNDTLPTFEAARESVDSLIRVPFEEVKKRIRSMAAFRFDRSLLLVPPKRQLEFCSKDSSISDFFDGVLRTVSKIRTVAMSVLIACAVLVCIPMAWVDVRFVRVTAKVWDQAVAAPLPYMAALALWLRNRNSFHAGNHATQWLFAYVTTIPMLFVLTLGIAGLLSCLVQLVLVESIQRATPRLTSQVVDFARATVGSLEETSVAWSGQTNRAIRELDGQINRDVFGYVNITTTAINSTLDEFVAQTNREIEDAFGGTVLHEPVQGVLKCLVGLKVASLQQGLTWVRDHAHVTFPDVKNNTFTVGAAVHLSGGDSAADLLTNTDNKASDAITAALNGAVDKLAGGLRSETVVAGALVGAWLSFAVAGAIYACVARSADKRRRKDSWPLHARGSPERYAR